MRVRPIIPPGVLGLIALFWAGVLAGSWAAIIDVNVGDDLVAKFDSAKAGDTLVLAQDTFTLPAGTSLTVTTAKSGLTIKGDGDVQPYDIEIAASGQPAIIVEVDAELTLRNLAITGADTAIQAMANASLTMSQCLIQGAENAVRLTEVSQATLVSSSISEGTNGVELSSGGKLTVFQCTFKDNSGTAVNAEAGVVHVGACLFSGNGTALDGPPVGNIESYKNHFDSNGTDMSGGVNDTAIVPAPPAPDFNTATWPGDLNAAIPTGGPLSAWSVSLPSNLEDLAKVDFEHDQRALDAVQVGADEVGGIGALSGWIDCFVAPFIVGLDGTAYIFVEVDGIALADARVYIIPEDSSAEVNSLIAAPGFVEEWPLWQSINTSGIDDTFGDAYIAFPSTWYSWTGDDVLADGVATVLLYVSGAFYGLGVDEDPMTDAAKNGSQFLVDTLPPRISETCVSPFACTSTAGGCWNFNPALPTLVPEQVGFFFSGGGPLAFSVSLLLEDPYPVDAGGLDVLIQRAGFQGDLVYAEGSAASILFDASGQPGAPTWGGSLTSVQPEIQATDAANVTFAYPETEAALFGDAYPSLETLWGLSGLNCVITGANNWHILAQFAVYDLAGNPLGIPYPALDLWWMQYARAIITSVRLQGEEVDVPPVFTWDLVHGLDTASPPPACQPVYHYRLWAALNSNDPADVAYTAWEAIGGWATTLNKSLTVNPAVLEEHAGRLMLFTIVAEDEAGNVQNVPTGAAGGELESIAALLQSGTVCGAAADVSIDFDYWVNAGTGGFKPPPTLAAQFWYNNTSGDTIPGPNQAYNHPEQLRRLLGVEYGFGASTRIPIVPLGEYYCDYRIEAEFTINPNLADAAMGAGAGVIWELFEDGKIAASGTLTAATGLGSESLRLYIPSDLFNPGDSVYDVFVKNAGDSLAFLNDRPSSCNWSTADRLGDDGDGGGADNYRRRSVDYVFQARTVPLDVIETYQDMTEIQELLQPYTPASVQFTVTVGSVSKDEQPIKLHGKAD